MKRKTLVVIILDLFLRPQQRYELLHYDENTRSTISRPFLNTPVVARPRDTSRYEKLSWSLSSTFSYGRELAFDGTGKFE
jgi:hypothetical protein